MNVTKALWAALSGSVTVIALMAGAWASDTTKRSDDLVLRMNIAEQHYAAIQSDLQDLRDHIREVEQLLRENRQQGK